MTEQQKRWLTVLGPILGAFLVYYTFTSAQSFLAAGQEALRVQAVEEKKAAA